MYIEDLNGKKIVFIQRYSVSRERRAVNWDEVEKYLRQYVGELLSDRRLQPKIEFILDRIFLDELYASANYHSDFERSKCESKSECRTGNYRILASK